MNACRLLLDAPCSGARNMAVDEALLLTAGQRRDCTLRFYGWTAPTLSLGYFQKAADREGHRSSLACSMVRRLSGGGAILHDAEVTYCLTLPAGHALAANSPRMYGYAHAALTELLAQWGVEAEMAVSNRSYVARVEPFLCFQRRSPGDVVLKGAKIAGSAQRRRQGGILQHGSLLLKASQAALELPGIDELVGLHLDKEDVARRWANEIGRQMDLTLLDGTLTVAEAALAESLETEKYGAESWNLRR